MNINIEEISHFFDKISDHYDEHFIIKTEMQPFYDEIEEILQYFGNISSLLDLGCGTGLELERVFKVFPDILVTCIDISGKMIKRLIDKFEDKKDQLKVICNSYFNVDLGNEQYDCVISSYSLHHFCTDEKSDLYKRICFSLKPNGFFINGDLIAKTGEMEKQYLDERARLINDKGLAEGMYNYDIPLAKETERFLLINAGFSQIKIYKEWENSAIFISNK